MNRLVNLMMLLCLIGFLLVISPFALGFGAVTIATSTNIILGVIVFILGLIGLNYNEKVSPGSGHTVKKTI